MNPAELIFDGALWIAVAIAALAGLLSFVSPCVLPLVPGYFGFLGSSLDGSATPSRRQRSRLLLGVALFVAGFTVVFLTVTVLGGLLGRFFLEYSAVITRVLGVVIIAMGLTFLGLFRVGQRSFAPRVSGRLGLAGAPVLGLALGIGWTPCIGPTLAAIMAVSWNLGDPFRAALLGLAYSLGLGLPFFLLAWGAGWASRSVGFVRRHIRLLNVIGGCLLILLGVAMVTGVWGALMSTLQGVMLRVTLPI